MKKEQKITNRIKPQSEAKQEKVKFVYDELRDMIDVSTAKYPEFNDRSLKEFLDDSQKRANSYVPTREDQGKEDWQANFFSPTTRNKVKALIAGIAKNPPEIAMTARNDKDQMSVQRAEVMKTVTEATFFEGDNNPEIEMYFDGWNNAINGTVVKYMGHLKIKGKVKVVTDYNYETGEVEFDESEEVIRDECLDLDISLTNFLIKNPYIKDVQDQPRVAWVEYKTLEEIEFEFGQFKDFNLVQDGTQEMAKDLQDSFFLQNWKDRVSVNGSKTYELVRMYDKINDFYRIVINGVLILDTPLLWGRKRKKYPFAKTICESFANTKFFWGNNIPNILMGEQDVENAFVMSLTDKTYRSLVKPLIIGQVNKDDFDLEDENVTLDTRIYVNDVSQVTPLPFEGVTNSEITMLKIIKAGMDQSTTDSVQNGTGGSGSTAREIVIANERAEEIKGLFFTFMKDLWIQKYRLRSLDVLMTYSTSMFIDEVGEDGEKIMHPILRTYSLANQQLSTGQMGTKQIEVVNGRENRSRPYALDVREAEMSLQGKPTEITQITNTYLDDHDYPVVVQSDSMYQKSKALKMAMNQEKINGVATLFPEIFMANKEEFFKSFIDGYGDSPDKYLENMQNMPQPQVPGMPGAPGEQGQEAVNPMMAAAGQQMPALPQLA